VYVAVAVYVAATRYEVITAETLHVALYVHVPCRRVDYKDILVVAGYFRAHFWILISFDRVAVAEFPVLSQGFFHDQLPRLPFPSSLQILPSYICLDAIEETY
jgi:hypothetical protein